MYITVAKIDMAKITAASYIELLSSDERCEHTVYTLCRHTASDEDRLMNVLYVAETTSKTDITFKKHIATRYKRSPYYVSNAQHEMSRLQRYKFP